MKTTVFAISGNKLKIIETLERKQSILSIRIRTVDQGGYSVENNFNLQSHDEPIFVDLDANGLVDNTDTLQIYISDFEAINIVGPAI